MREADPDILVDVTTEPNAFRAEITRNSLVSVGIPAFAATTVGSMMAWEIASGMPIRVQVRRRDLVAARAHLEGVQADSASIDWDAEEIGKPEDGEVAASQPATPNWAEKREEKKSVAQTMIWLASIAAFGPVAAIVFLVGGISRLINGKGDAK